MESHHQPAKKEVWPIFQKAKWQKPKFYEKSGLTYLDWNDIKDVLKAMWRKYKKEDDHELFDSFIDQAGAVWSSFKKI